MTGVSISCTLEAWFLTGVSILVCLLAVVFLWSIVLSYSASAGSCCFLLAEAWLPHCMWWQVFSEDSLVQVVQVALPLIHLTRFGSRGVLVLEASDFWGCMTLCSPLAAGGFPGFLFL